MSAKLLPLALAAAFLATPALAQAPYTDHYGQWSFTGLGTPAGAVDTGMVMGAESVLLRLADGNGFTAFVFGVPLSLVRTLPYQLWRPPLLAFECYSDLGTGNLIVRGQTTQVAGSCIQTVEQVNGESRYVVRFQGYQVPVRGTGVYCVDAAPASC